MAAQKKYNVFSTLDNLGDELKAKHIDFNIEKVRSLVAATPEILGSTKFKRVTLVEILTVVNPERIPQVFEVFRLAGDFTPETRVTSSNGNLMHLLACQTPKENRMI